MQDQTGSTPYMRRRSNFVRTKSAGVPHFSELFALLHRVLVRNGERPPEPHRVCLVLCLGPCLVARKWTEKTLKVEAFMFALCPNICELSKKNRGSLRFFFFFFWSARLDEVGVRAITYSPCRAVPMKQRELVARASYVVKTAAVVVASSWMAADFNRVIIELTICESSSFLGMLQAL